MGLVGIIPLENLLYAGYTWLVGDMIGVLLIEVFYLSFYQRRVLHLFRLPKRKICLSSNHFFYCHSRFTSLIFCT